jgi:hypothetical protein
MMTMATKTAALITSRDRKGIAIIGLLEAALNKAKLDGDQAQRVFEHGGEVQADVVAILAKYGTDAFADEEVSSNCGYLSGYTGPKSIADQLAILRLYFPELGSADEAIAGQLLPAGAEGYFAIPRWRLIASTYVGAVAKALEALKKQRNDRFQNYREGQLGPAHLRESDRKRLGFQRFGNEQEGHDVLVVAAQFGIRHRGKSVRRARFVMFGNEFGLGAFETIIMVLTHPERLAGYNDLWVDCAGDEFSFAADGTFDSVSYLHFLDGRVGFGVCSVDFAHKRYGSASGFSPQ